MDSDSYFSLYSGEDRYYSHSFLKREQNGISPHLEITAKIKLGKMVDAILMSPNEVDPSQPEFKQACVIASAIKVKFGTLIKNFIPQVGYTAQMAYKGLLMNTCGRVDWLLEKHSIIDLKVTDAKTDAEFAKVCDYMGYPNQMFNYRGLAEVKQSFILPYSVKAKACLSVVKMEYSPTSEEFFRNAIIKFGR